jgi:hypothetical protein
LANGRRGNSRASNSREKVSHTAIHLYLSSRGLRRDRNWLEFVSILDATFLPATRHESMHPDLEERVAKTRDLFTKVAEQDGNRDRAAWLGLMELERVCGVHEVPTGV